MFLRPAARLNNTSYSVLRRLHVSPTTNKTVKEKVEDVAHDVNMKVGKGLASAMEKGEEITEAAKERLGSVSDKAKSNLDHTSKAGKEKANQTAAGARAAKAGMRKELEK